MFIFGFLVFVLDVVGLLYQYHNQVIGQKGTFSVMFLMGR